jgi:hypothetical protein
VILANNYNHVMDRAPCWTSRCQCREAETRNYDR